MQLSIVDFEPYYCNRSIFEIPFTTYILPRVAATIALAGAIWYTYPSFLWVQKPATLNPEFIAEAKRIGNVAVRDRVQHHHDLNSASQSLFILLID